MKEKAARKQRAPWKQRRGEERRRLLLQATAELLVDHELDEISLDAVARRSGIPLTSVYHFYGDKHALLSALAVRYGDEFAQLLGRPLPGARIKRWEDVLELLIARAVRYYGANPAARKLLIDGQAPADIKLADRAHDRVLGKLLESSISRHFEIPQFAERDAVFYHSVEIVDLLLQLSMIQWRRITPKMVEHARVASIGYLRSFLPAKLPRVRTETVGG